MAGKAIKRKSGLVKTVGGSKSIRGRKGMTNRAYITAAREEAEAERMVAAGPRRFPGLIKGDAARLKRHVRLKRIGGRGF